MGQPIIFQDLTPHSSCFLVVASTCIKKAQLKPNHIEIILYEH